MKKIIVLIFLVFTIVLANAQIYLSQKQKLDASDREVEDYFGNSVSIDGDYAIVGARSEDHDISGGASMSYAGSAYIYERDGGGNWIEVQKIVASDRDVGDNFGTSVAISGNYAIVGSPRDFVGAYMLGSAYIFERIAGTWIEVMKVSAPSNLHMASFGASVSIHGDYIIIGAYRNGMWPDYNGAAYIYERIAGTWTYNTQLTASDPDIDDYYGFSVSLSGDYAVIGAYYEDEDESGSNTLDAAGSAYIYERDGGGNWNEVDKIVAFDRATGDEYGKAVAVSGDYLVVGANREDEDESGANTIDQAGSAYVYERDGGGNWNFTQKLVAVDRNMAALFGWSVGASGDYFHIGAQTDNQNPCGGIVPTSGASYLFKRNSGGVWSEVQKLHPDEHTTGDQFGYSVAISGNYCITGAWGEDEDENGINTLNDAGAAYVFEPDTLDPQITVVYDTICNGDSIFLQLGWQTLEGSYYDILESATGCDSIVRTDLTLTTVSVSGIVTNDVLGSCIGAIDITPSGGTPVYSYNWSPVVSINEDISNLCVGTYIVTVTDAMGCYVIDTFVVSDNQNVEICYDGIDNDGDGLIDMLDSLDCECNDSVVTMQYIIPNPSFEDNTDCPDGNEQLYLCDYWTQVSNGSSDYFNTCDWLGFGDHAPVPFSDGSSCVGFYSTLDYQEYIGTCLLYRDQPILFLKQPTQFVQWGSRTLYIANQNSSGFHISLYQ